MVQNSVPNFLLVVFLSFAVVVSAKHFQTDLCPKSARQPDPCEPGGHFDTLEQKCTGVEGADCFQCYSGPRCTEDPNCQFLKALGGYPILFQEFWLKSEKPCVSVPSDFRPSYMLSQTVAPELATTIRNLHAIIGNAKTEGYTVVVGYGATQVNMAALHAVGLSRSAASPLRVFAQTPFYSGYESQVKSTINDEYESSMMWDLTVDPANPDAFEIVTHRNNPDSELRYPKVTDANRTLYDCAYCWPQFGPIGPPLEGDIMTFTLSKLTGHAGTRLGWALVKDPVIASAMSSYVTSSTLGVSVDAQLRALELLQALTANSGEQKSANAIGTHADHPFFDFAVSKMEDRWMQLSTVFGKSDGKTEATTLNITLANVHRVGGYAWIHCPNRDCVTVLEAVGVQGISGVNFGASSSYCRLQLMMPDGEFIIMMKRLSTLDALSWDALPTFSSPLFRGQARQPFSLRQRETLL